MDSDLYQRQAQKKLILIAAGIVLGGVLYWHFFRVASFRKPADIPETAQQVAVTQVEKPVSKPAPLRAPPPAVSSPAPSSVLTRPGIIAETNVQRKENGDLPPLAESAPLNEAAQLRLQDMFQKQYFGHVSPSGGSAGSAEAAVQAAGYEYLALGENLALGVFAGDKDVVKAWMNSPGHRASILNSRYTEIGVAAREGVFEGNKTWIAVQVFGRPSSDCPSPDPGLKTAIENAESRLSVMQADIQAKKADIDATEPRGGSAYNQKVTAYNKLVEEHNALVNQAKAYIATYNKEVAAFNKCIAP